MGSTLEELEEEIMAGKKESITTFNSSEAFSIWLNLAVGMLDRPRSEVIRCCIMLALPMIVSNPSLVGHVRFEDILTKDLGK